MLIAKGSSLQLKICRDAKSLLLVLENCCPTACYQWRVGTSENFQSTADWTQGADITVTIGTPPDDDFNVVTVCGFVRTFHVVLYTLWA